MDASNNQSQTEWTPEQAKSEVRWALGESIGMLALIAALAMSMGGVFGESESQGEAFGLWSDCGKGGRRHAPMLSDLDLGHAAWCAVGSLFESAETSDDEIGLRFDFFDRRH